MTNLKSEHLASLNDQLTQIKRQLDSSISLIRRHEPVSKANIRRIADAMVKITEVQCEIWDKDPELAPDYVREKWTPGGE